MGENADWPNSVKYLTVLLQNTLFAGRMMKRNHIIGVIAIYWVATILPVSICDQVVIGAGSVVTKDITEPGIYAGNPAKKLR